MDGEWRRRSCTTETHPLRLLSNHIELLARLLQLDSSHRGQRSTIYRGSPCDWGLF